MQIEKQFNDLKILDLTPDPMIIIDIHGNLIEINDPIEKVTGYTRQELIGKNFLKLKLLTDKSKILAIKNLAKRIAGFKVEPYEIEITTKDGIKLHYEINAKRITYQGKIADAVTFRNITTRKKEEEKITLYSEGLRKILNEKHQKLVKNEERFRYITESSIDIIYEMDLDTKITYISSSVKEITGYQPEEIVGRYIHELTGKIDISLVQAKLKEFTEGKKN